MRSPRPTPPPTAVSLTPLIDVVFLLIIFFLVSSHLVRRETLTPVTLPAASTGTRADDRPRLTLTVQPSGEIWFGGRNQPIAQLREVLGRHGGPAGSSPDPTAPAPPLRIRCDAAAPYAVLSPVLAAAAAAGCHDIVLATQPADNTAPTAPPSNPRT